MLELNVWFFVLVAQFIATLWILNLILFKPFIKIFHERKNTVEGAMKAARDMSESKDNALEDMRRDLMEARAKSKAVFEALRNEGLQSQRETVSKAGADAMAMSEKAREELKAEAEKARAGLRADVQRLSSQIMERLIKA